MIAAFPGVHGVRAWAPTPAVGARVRVTVRQGPELGQFSLLAGAVALPGEYGAGLRVGGRLGSLPLRGGGGRSGLIWPSWAAGAGTMGAGCL
jgi:hypothetical protein